MGFAEQAESWRAKAHLSGVRLPVLVGVTALAGIVLFLAGSAMVRAAGADGFSVSHDQGALAQEEADDEAKSPGAAEEAPAIVVHVGGAVAEPGVRELPQGARVQDAVDAAGGFAEGAAHDELNLARSLTDGEQIVVPTQEEAEAASNALDGGAVETQMGVAAGGKVNLNKASAAQLDALPGVGPSTAEKIVADREANGPFATVEDLKRVSGIGDKKFADLADLVCVG